MEMSESERIAKEYFHGTSKEYVERQLTRHGRYQHDELEYGNSVNLTKSLELAARAAFSVCNQYRSPAILRLDGDKLRDRIYVHPSTDQIVIDFLKKSEFELLEL